jgi:hypothetical protein
LHLINKNRLLDINRYEKKTYELKIFECNTRTLINAGDLKRSYEILFEYIGLKLSTKQKCSQKYRIPIIASHNISIFLHYHLPIA